MKNIWRERRLNERGGHLYIGRWDYKEGTSVLAWSAPKLSSHGVRSLVRLRQFLPLLTYLNWRDTESTGVNQTIRPLAVLGQQFFNVLQHKQDFLPQGPFLACKVLLYLVVLKARRIHLATTMVVAGYMNRPALVSGTGMFLTSSQSLESDSIVTYSFVAGP